MKRGRVTDDERRRIKLMLPYMSRQAVHVSTAFIKKVLHKHDLTRAMRCALYGEFIKRRKVA